MGSSDTDTNSSSDEESSRESVAASAGPVVQQQSSQSQPVPAKPEAVVPRAAASGTNVCEEVVGLVGQAIEKASEQAHSYVTTPTKTHKKEYDKFLKQCGTKKFPMALANDFMEDKVNLFNTWLECGGDLQKVATLAVSKKVSKETAAKRQSLPFKKRDLLLKYTPEQVAEIMTWCRKHNSWEPDPIFPDNEEENYYTIYQGAAFEKTKVSAEVMSVEATQDLDAEMTEAMVGKDGPLGPNTTATFDGAMSNVNVAALMQESTSAVEAAAKAQTEARKKTEKEAKDKEKEEKKRQKAAELEAAGLLTQDTFREQCFSLIEKVKKDWTAGNAFAISLENHESRDTVGLLIQHVNFMESTLKGLHKLLQADCKDMFKLAHIQELLEPKFAWFDSRKKTYALMETELNGSKKAKKERKEPKEPRT